MSDEVTIELRYNDDTEELAVVAVDGENEEVLLKTPSEGVKSIVESYNAKHPEVKVVIEEVRPAEVQAAPIVAGPAAVETTEPVVVDKPAEA